MATLQKARHQRRLLSRVLWALAGCLCAAALTLNLALLDRARNNLPQQDLIEGPSGFASRTTNATIPLTVVPVTTTHEPSYSKELPYMERQFVYANQTYTYRYSTKPLRKRRIIDEDSGYNDGGSELEAGLPSVLFGVCANAAKPVRRQVIRKSWGKEARVYFLVAGGWEDVAKEFSRAGDLLWLDVPEDYRNALTPKTFAFLHLGHYLAAPENSMSEELPSFDYVFKTDDDVYVNATEMRIELERHGRPAYYGLLRENVTPARDKSETGLVSKWYLSEKDYSPDVFPPYAHGTGYALAGSFLACAVDTMASPSVVGPSGMPWEDVATGMLAQACGVSLEPADKDWSHFVPFESSEWTAFPYQRFKDGNVPVKILHKVKPWFFEPLSQRASLKAAREYGTKKIVDRKHRRQNSR